MKLHTTDAHATTVMTPSQATSEGSTSLEEPTTTPGPSPKPASGRKRARGVRRNGRPAEQAPLPSVNLLSPSALERLATRRLRRRFVAAAATLVVLVAAGWGVQHLRVGEAEQLLTVEQAETARLTEETRALLPVRTFVTGVQQQVSTVSDTMAREIYFSEVLDGLEDAAPSRVRLDSVTVTLAPPPAPQAPAAESTDADAGATSDSGEAATPAPSTTAPEVSPCPGPDPFQTRTVVGCVTLSGTAGSRADVGDLVIQLGDDPLFVEPFISTTTTADEAGVTFSGSVGLSKRVFSKRYQNLDALLAEGTRR